MRKGIFKRALSLLITLTIIFTMTITPAADEKQDVGDFVTRLYDICLDRKPDSSGFDDWTSQLTDGTNTGVGVAYGFIFSDEFQSLDVSNDQYVELMYNCFFGRASDPAGKADWLGKMNGGMSRQELFAGFANSIEFRDLCSEYGIEQGSYSVDAGVAAPSGVNRNKIIAFVTRLYSTFLGREPDEGGLNDWVDQLASGKITGSQAAYGFIFSNEYKSMQRSDRQFVTDLYVGFLGREPDEQGLSSWIYMIACGSNDLQIFNGFVGSQEWIGLCRSYGIDAGGAVTGDLYARVFNTVVPYDGQDAYVMNTPTPTPATVHSHRTLATANGITFTEAYTTAWDGEYSDCNTCNINGREELCCIIYVSGKVNEGDFYIKYKGDEGFRDIDGHPMQYIPDYANATVTAEIRYKDDGKVFYLDAHDVYDNARFEYMKQQGYGKLIYMNVTFAKKGEHSFDLYYRGTKINTYTVNNAIGDAEGTIGLFNGLDRVINAISQYKPNMSDMEMFTAACYWYRNQSYEGGYTCWCCHGVANIMKCLGYTAWSLSCTALDENGRPYNDYGNYYSLSPNVDTSHSSGHRICMVRVDPTHYLWVEVQGSLALAPGETYFGKPWEHYDPGLIPVHEELELLRDYDNVYDMMLGDYGIDITTFDATDCSTWYR